MPRHLGPSLILLATLVATLWLGPSVVRRAAWSHTETQLTTVRDSLATDTDLTLLSNAFERVAQVVEPSVVHIQVFHRKTPGGNWFNRYDPAAPSGNGSGWIYRHFSSNNNNNADYEDVILTNHHVVDGAGRIVVRLADGREHDATLLASDQATDMAVLRLPTAGPLHAAALSLNPVAKGQIVFAFGSPLAFDFSVSQGIVSASGRQLSLDSSGRYESYIQTDAAINPGNSGGPLTDIHGRVVGMNFAIASDPGPDSPHNSPHTLRPSTPSRGFLGLGFAIPVNIAVQVADQMIADGQVNRGYLAVYIADLAPNMAKALGHPANTQGVLISHPLTHGPGHAAGLLPGDIVTAVANQPVTTAGELRYRVSTFPPGASINLNVLRPSTPQPFQLTATLDTLPKEVPRHRVPQPDFTSNQSYTHDTLRKFGIERLADFTPDAAHQLGQPAPDTITAPMILDVRYGSIASAQRLPRQTLITHIDQHRIRNTQELTATLSTHNTTQPLLLTTRRWEPTLKQYRTSFVLLALPGG